MTFDNLRLMARRDGLSPVTATDLIERCEKAEAQLATVKELAADVRKAGGDTLEFLANEYGNSRGEDWANTEAGDVADNLDAALEALNDELKEKNG